MAWVLARGGTSPQWVKWCWESYAQTWMNVIRQEVGRAEQTESDATPIETKWERTRALFDAIRGLAMSMDCDPLDFAPYAPSRLDKDGGTDDLPGLYLAENPWRRAVMAVLTRVSPELREHLAGGGALNLFLYPRIDLTGTPDRTVGEVRDVPNTPEGEGDLTRADGDNIWDYMGWREWYPGFGEASHVAHISVLLPLKWSWELARDCGRVILREGIEGTVSLTSLWIPLRNTRVARITGGRGLPSEIVEAAAALELAHLGSGSPSPAETAAVASIVAIATSINPLAGACVALMLGLQRILEGIFGRASGAAFDVWGRRQPAVSKFDFRGSILDPQEPPPGPPPAPPYSAVAYLPDPIPNLEITQPLIRTAPKSTTLGKVAKVAGAFAIAKWLL